MPTQATNGSLLIMTAVKAIVALMVVGTLCYCTIRQIPVEGVVLTGLLGLLGLKEVISSLVYNEARKSSHARRP